MGHLENLGKVVQAPVNFGNTVKNSTDLMDKGCKVGKFSVTVIDSIARVASNTATTAWQPLTNLARALGGFCSVISAFNLINRIAEFVLRNKQGNYSWMSWRKNKVTHLDYKWMEKSWNACGSKLTKAELNAVKTKASQNRFQDDGYWTWMRTGFQTGLTVCHAIDFVSFFDAIGAIALGAAGFVINTVKNVIYLPVALLNIADSGYHIHMSKRYVTNCTAKIQKWRDLREKGVDELKNHYATKIEKMQLKVDSLMQKHTEINDAIQVLNAHSEAAPPSKSDVRQAALEAEEAALNSFIGLKEKKIRHLQHYLVDFDDHAFADLNRDSTDAQFKETNIQFFKDCTWKIEQWRKNAEIAKSNSYKIHVKNWLNIANQIGKFALGVICLVGLIITVTTPIGLATAPIFVLVTSIGWLATHIFGFAKSVYAAYNPMRKIEAPRLNYDTPVALLQTQTN